MSLRSTLSVTVACIGLTGVAGVSAYLTLRACALQFPLLRHLSSCKPPEQLATAQRLDATYATGQDLRRRIFELERELAALQCIKAPPDASGPLNDEGWVNNDPGMLYGCWALDTTYRTRDVDTGTIRTYSDWQMCFDTEGNGRQIMQSNDGIVCEGTVQAQLFEGRMNLIEPGNLACADGGYIHQREIVCVPAPGGKAICDTLQPETKGEATIGFERELWRSRI